ncbi:hypothetical protein N0V93_005870 [Gnomoniopsis smithogilvyi]|uniref:Uncharacterized protein n=1 Tax=Gnomoniopsis smithogilvyi TaxID=1191159 RepID=A0A9W8YWE1_9PEZI|nr:hypothetical protein N0V93_005870 [Gnomoniopsis smithogilvyi]
MTDVKEDAAYEAMWKALDDCCCSKAKVSLTHITNNQGGLCRLLAVIRGVVPSQVNEETMAVWYVVSHEAEVDVISGYFRDNLDWRELFRELFTFTEPQVGKMFITTYSAVRQLFSMRENGPSSLRKQLVIMDMGMGLQSAEMAVAARAWMEYVVDDSRKTYDPPRSYSLLSISNSEALIDSAMMQPYVEAVEGWDPTIRAHRIEFPLMPTTCHSVDDWPTAIKNNIVSEWQAKKTTGQTIVCLMASHEVDALAEAVKKVDKHIPVVTYFLHPWTNKETTDMAADSSELRLLYVNPEISFVPEIKDIKAIYIGQTMDQFVMDHNISTVVRACIPTPSTVMSLASAIAASHLQTESIGIHALSRTVDLAKTPNHPRKGRDLMYMLFKMTQVCPGGGTLPWLDSSVGQAHGHDIQWQVESAKRLVLLKLNEYADMADESELMRNVFRMTRTARESIPDLDLATDQGNKMNALVLLGCIRDTMSEEVRRIIIELAALIWMDPVAIYKPSFKPRLRRLMLENCSQRKSGYLTPYLHQGQLWSALGWLWACERFFSGMAPTGLATFFAAAINTAALERVVRQKKAWLDIFKVEDRKTHRGDLSMNDFLDIEKSLVRAFLFNSMLVIGNSHGSPAPYFGRDVASQIVLQTPVESVRCEDMVDWKQVIDASPETGIFAIYTHLERTQDLDGKWRYTPLNATIVSKAAMQPVMQGMAPQGLRSLQPILRVPEYL